jgi:hypothetical protein
MLLRFVVLQRDIDSHVEQGLFNAAHELRCAGELAEYELELVEELFRWFNRHLPIPCRFARSRKSHAHKRAISWFKPTAQECIARMQVLASLLQEHGYPTQRLTTNRPGYVVYEDDYQVVAEVFRAEHC